MSKPFKTIDEQIELLRYRGMTIADDEVARHALETLGYYRLSGYWGYRTLRVAGRVTFRLIGAGKSVF